MKEGYFKFIIVLCLIAAGFVKVKESPEFQHQKEEKVISQLNNLNVLAVAKTEGQDSNLLTELNDSITHEDLKEFHLSN